MASAAPTARTPDQHDAAGLFQKERPPPVSSPAASPVPRKAPTGVALPFGDCIPASFRFAGRNRLHE